MDEELDFDIPITKAQSIKVIGVGGGGGNAVNHMYELGIKDVDFVLCNTDSQVLAHSPIKTKIQLGQSLTDGRGAGNKPDIGEKAAIESLPRITEMLKDTQMVFITAGMGGGTGTGAAPVIAKAAKELGILTVAIVTVPFRSEGKRRIAQAIDGINRIFPHVDSLLIVNNEKILQMYGKLRITEAFTAADDVLATAAKSIAEIITVRGYINIDFADVETVIKNSGVALMGSGIASGENRALDAVKKALESPLLENNDISGARNLLLNITYGNEEIQMDEAGDIIEYLQSVASQDEESCSRKSNDVDIIWGSGFDETLGENLKVTIIATGFAEGSIPELYASTHKVERVHIGEEVTSNIFPSSETGFKEVKHGGSRRIVEFEVFPADKFATPNAEKPAHTTVSLPKKTITPPTWDNIAEFDDVPAFIRQKVKLNEEPESKPETEISRIIFDEKGGDIVIRPDNTYLYDNVD